jgi:hypothetical protein
MSEPFNEDRLYQLLEDYEPEEILTLYGEQIRSQPELVTILEGFDQLDKDFEQLANLSPPPEPDYARIRSKQKAEVFHFQRYVLPVAALLVLAIGLSIGFWDQGVRQSPPSSEQRVQEADKGLSPGLEILESEAETNEERLTDAVRRDDTAVPEPPPVAVSSGQMASESADAPVFSGEQTNRQKAPSLALPPSEVSAVERERRAASKTEELAPLFEPVEEPLTVTSDSAPQEMIVVLSAKSTDPWACVKKELEAWANGEEPFEKLSFKEGLVLNWQFLEVEGADLQQLDEARDALLERESDGLLTLIQDARDDQVITLTWKWQALDGLRSGKLQITVAAPCQVIEWREIQ